MATTIVTGVARLVFWTLRALFLSRQSLAIENLGLRQQVAALKFKRPRPLLDTLDRAFWIALREVWADWVDSLVIVKPETVVKWQRQGFRCYWRFISRGRPRIRPHIREVIRRMARENLTWGAPRIHGELLKLGFCVSERTVSRYMPRRRRPGAVAQWRTFLRNHGQLLVGMDFLVVPTATFRLLYVLVLIHHGSRRILHFNVTEHPAAEWVVQNLHEAFPGDYAVPCYVILDRDSIFSARVTSTLRSFGMNPVRTAYRSPWQNPFVERWIGSLRRELLDHVVVLGERHLYGLVSDYIGYHHRDRTHLGLDKDTPEQRPKESARPGARVHSAARLGGLHHRYSWKQAA